MGQPAVRVAVVDIGTNSIRMLITDGATELGRWVEVTGLGRGVDESALLSTQAVSRTLAVLQRFGGIIDDLGVDKTMALATSASRDAENRAEFFDAAEEVLGFRPQLTSGEREARLAFAGATAGLESLERVVVSDIGGGSTEVVGADFSHSIDIGSVRLTERELPDRPPPPAQLMAAQVAVRSLMEVLEATECGRLLGVAGTWTSLAAIAQDLPAYERSSVHDYVLTRERLEVVTDHLSRLTVAESAAIPSLDPKRAPVILAGSVIALEIVKITGAQEVTISERDTLDGAAAELLALA